MREPRRLLLIDDHDLVRRSLQRALSLRGFEVHAASSVAEAVELARSMMFDAVLADYHGSVARLASLTSMAWSVATRLGVGRRAARQGRLLDRQRPTLIATAP